MADKSITNAGSEQTPDNISQIEFNIYTGLVLLMDEDLLWDDEELTAELKRITDLFKEFERVDVTKSILEKPKVTIPEIEYLIERTSQTIQIISAMLSFRKGRDLNNQDKLNFDICIYTKSHNLIDLIQSRHWDYLFQLEITTGQDHYLSDLLIECGNICRNLAEHFYNISGKIKNNKVDLNEMARSAWSLARDLYYQGLNSFESIPKSAKIYKDDELLDLWTNEQLELELLLRANVCDSRIAESMEGDMFYNASEFVEIGNACLKLLNKLKELPQISENNPMLLARTNFNLAIAMFHSNDLGNAAEFAQSGIAYYCFIYPKLRDLAPHILLHMFAGEDLLNSMDLSELDAERILLMLQLIEMFEQDDEEGGLAELVEI